MNNGVLTQKEMQLIQFMSGIKILKCMDRKLGCYLRY